MSAPPSATAQVTAPGEISCPSQAPSVSWSFSALSGRLLEVGSYGRRREGSASLTMVAEVLHQAQTFGAATAWIRARDSLFLPADMAAFGLDLQALALLTASGPTVAARMADRLLHSGAFGAVVLDLPPDSRLTTAIASRLAALARHHRAVVILLAESERPERASTPMVSLRAETFARPLRSGLYQCGLRALRDKRGAPGWTTENKYRAPAGLR